MATFPLRVKSVSFSFLNIFQVPTEKATKSYSIFRDPDSYYSYISGTDTRVDKVLVKQIGKFRPALPARNMRPKKYPSPDEIWYNMNQIYSTLSETLHMKLPFFPAIPSVLDYLPSKHRTYALDGSILPGSLSTQTARSPRVSLSMYYFPLGYAISRVSVFFEGDFDPNDIVTFSKSPDSFLRLTLFRKTKGTRTAYIHDELFGVVDMLQKRFIQALTASDEDLSPKSLGRYTVIDFAETSRKYDEHQDKEMISRLIAAHANADTYPNINSFGEGMTIPTDRRLFIWLPKSVEYRICRLHRRRARIVAMLLMIQKLLYVPVMALDMSLWHEMVRSGNFFNQLRRGVFTPSLVLPFSIMHYLQIHTASFGNRKGIQALYSGMRGAMDTTDSIESATTKLEAYLEQMRKEVENSGQEVATVFNSILQLLHP